MRSQKKTVGVLSSVPAGEAQPPSAEAEPLVDSARAAAAEPSALPIIEADVDGRRVRLTAQDEIVLQCGKASITLRRNGRVIVRGTYIETHSEGTNRIKGGQVQIN